MSKNEVIGATFALASIDASDLAASVKTTGDATLLLSWIAAGAAHATDPKRYAYLISLASETMAMIIQHLPDETRNLVIRESREKKWVHHDES